MDIETLKTKIIEFLASVDLSVLTMQDLSIYVNTVSTVDSMAKGDNMEKLLNLMSSGGYGLGAAPQSAGVCGIAEKGGE